MILITDAGMSKRDCSRGDRTVFNSNLVGLFTDEYQRAATSLQSIADTKGLFGWLFFNFSRKMTKNKLTKPLNSPNKLPSSRVACP